MKRIISTLLLCCSLIAPQVYAAAVTLATSAADTTDQTEYTSPAFTPAINDLIVALVTTGTPPTSTPVVSNSAGLTFTLAGTKESATVVPGLFATSGRVHYIFVADALASAIPQTIKYTQDNTANGTIMFAYRVSGMTRTGRAAILQIAHEDNRNSAYYPTLTFGAALKTGNPTILLTGSSVNPAGISPPSGWTEPAGGDLGYASNTTGAETAYRNSGSTATSVAWASLFPIQHGSLGVELDTSAATPGFPAACAGGRTAVGITSIADVAEVDNILHGQSPAIVAGEDTICYTATSTNGAAVTVSSAGWVTLASEGSNLTDSFTYCLMDNGTACGSDGTFQITETPVLSSPLGVQTGQTTADLSVSVAQVEGTVWACVSEDSGTPSHAQGAAGNDANGDPCAFDASDATPSASQAFSATGLTADTVYYASFGQSNAATAPLTATVVKSAAFQTEAAGDTTPDAFSFADVTGAVGGYEYVSSAIEIAGTTAATNVVITISGCEYAIDSGSGYGSYTSAAGVVQLGYGVRLRNTASLEALDTANCTPTIGGVSDTWYVTTRNETLVDFVNRLVRQLVQPLVDQGVK